ncbi:MAG: hypothetical protein HKN82_14200 [Akkermansiaceae bacterium]|nr:hypothetical protein [Akkermansiaceae bacterium]
MKPLLPLLFASILNSPLLLAEESKGIPDLAKAFPTEKLFNQTNLEGLESYSYATNLEFAELKKKFGEYLGKDWKVDPEIEKATKEAMEKRDLAMEGNSLFSNPEFPGVQIGLTQIKMELEGKKFVASVTVIRDRADQGGADQPAAAPESKPEGNENPKTESKARSQ